MRDWIRSRAQAPKAWAKWHVGAVSAYVPELLTVDGRLPDLIGGDHGARVNFPGTSVRTWTRDGRRGAAADGADGTRRWRGGYRNATASRLAAGDGVTLWWYGYMTGAGGATSTRICALEFQDPEFTPFFSGAAITLENSGLGYYVGTWTTQTNLIHASLFANAHSRPRLLVLVVPATDWSYRTLYDDGRVALASSAGTNTPPSTSSTTHLLMQGHTLVPGSPCDVGTIAAGYHNRMLSPAEIVRWSRDPLGPLTRDRSAVLYRAPRLNPLLHVGLG